MKIITFTNQKGGVAKTTTAHATASLLKQRGYRVLIIDLDPQGNMTFALKETATGQGAYEVLNNPPSILEEIQPTKYGDLIASSPKLATIDILLAAEYGKEYRLKEALTKVSKQYDFCIIDTPPTLNTLTINALSTANYLIIPLQADPFSIQGLYQLNDTIKAVKKYSNPSLEVLGIAITRYNNRPKARKFISEELEKVAADMDTKVYKTKIRECIAIVESQLNLQSIFDYAPNSNAAIDYESLVNEILNEV